MLLKTFYGSLKDCLVYTVPLKSNGKFESYIHDCIPQIRTRNLKYLLRRGACQWKLKYNVVFLCGRDPNQVFAYNNCLSTGVE